MKRLSKRALDELMALPDSDHAAFEAWNLKYGLCAVPLILLHGMGRGLKKQFEVLADRIDALEARPVLHEAGPFRAGTHYKPGAIVKHNGSGFLCVTEHLATGMRPDPDRFSMISKCETR